MRSAFFKLLIVMIVAGICSGCALNYSISEPVPSSFHYDIGDGHPAVLQIVDQRNDEKFFMGIGNLSRFDIKLENVKDPIDWLSRALQAEFASRGVPVEVAGKEFTGQADLVFAVRKYQIANYRASGFTPWVAYHSLGGDLKSRDGSYPVRSFFLYGKVPVWSMSEVHGPCLSMPMGILVRDVASKINRYALHYSASNGRLDEINAQLAEKMKSAAPDAYLSVLELGACNNPEAMPILKKTVESEDTLIRACALSCMGTLGAEKELDLLKQKYAEYADIDRFMALKAIGDVGTPEAVDFLKKAKAEPQNENEYAVKYCVDLYTE